MANYFALYKKFFLNVSWAEVFKSGSAVTRKAIFDGAGKGKRKPAFLKK